MPPRMKRTAARATRKGAQHPLEDEVQLALTWLKRHSMGRDALRELTSPAVIRRLAARPRRDCRLCRTMMARFARKECLMDWKLELVPVPVSDVDRAKAFYTKKVGFNLDHDHRMGEKLRVVALTPPGSACSIVSGDGIVHTPPGSVQGLHLVVSDIQAARAELVERGVEVSEVKDFGGGISFVFFKDPDGNSWAQQEIAPGARRPDDLDEARLRQLIADR